MDYPNWYQSSNGPQVSQTISSLVLNILPFANMILASKGINILPEDINFWVSLAVFAVFSIRAGIGYVKAKKVMGAKIAGLQQELRGNK